MTVYISTSCVGHSGKSITSMYKLFAKKCGGHGVC